MNKILLDALIKYRENLVSRDFIIDYFADAEYQTKEEAIRENTIKLGKLYTENDKLYLVTSIIKQDENNRQLFTNDVERFDPIIKIGNSQEIPFPEKKLSFYDRFTLTKGMIENHNGDPIITTIGVFLLNYVVLVKPFGDVIKYVNGSWNLGKIESDIAKKCAIDKVIEPKQIYRYVDYAYSLCSLTDFCVPSITERSITPNPIVIARRNELFEKYKDQLNDPNVMVMIEDEIISLDKKLMQDDDSSGFLIDGKNFNVQRKRMFHMIGLVETFGDDVKGYEFGKFNLNDGWNLDEMQIIANDIRRGSYNRAKSTALGGYQSKVLGRNFQDSSILEYDCGTTSGVTTILTEDNVNILLDKNIITKDGPIRLTKDNINEFMNKEVVIRSPMYCKTRDGYCYKCFDAKFEETEVKLLNIYPINIGSTFVTLSLKATHGTKVDMIKIDDINAIVI